MCPSVQKNSGFKFAFAHLFSSWQNLSKLVLLIWLNENV